MTRLASQINHDHPETAARVIAGIRAAATLLFAFTSQPGELDGAGHVHESGRQLRDLILKSVSFLAASPGES